MKSDWHQNFMDVSDFLDEFGVWDCKDESIAQAHVRMHKLGINIEGIKGYKNIYRGGGSRE